MKEDGTLEPYDVLSAPPHAANYLLKSRREFTVVEKVVYEANGEPLGVKLSPDLLDPRDRPIMPTRDSKLTGTKGHLEIVSGLGHSAGYVYLGNFKPFDLFSTVRFKKQPPIIVLPSTEKTGSPLARIFNLEIVLRGSYFSHDLHRKLLKRGGVAVDGTATGTVLNTQSEGRKVFWKTVHTRGHRGAGDTLYFDTKFPDLFYEVGFDTPKGPQVFYNMPHHMLEEVDSDTTNSR